MRMCCGRDCVKFKETCGPRQPSSAASFSVASPTSPHALLMQSGRQTAGRFLLGIEAIGGAFGDPCRNSISGLDYQQNTYHYDIEKGGGAGFPWICTLLSVMMVTETGFLVVSYEFHSLKWLLAANLPATTARSFHC